MSTLHAAARTLPQWTPSGTLLLAIALQAWPPPVPALSLDGIQMRRKRELHVTIVGSALGARVRAALDAGPSLRHIVDASCVALDWHWQRLGKWTLIEKRDGAQRRHALIEHIALPAMAVFHRQLGALLDTRLPAPPPHVTLYTSVGGKGIGLPDPDTLARLRVRDVAATELAGVLPQAARG